MDKITISLPRETLKRARGEVRRRRTTISAYIAEILEERVLDKELQADLDQMLAESGGPLTAAEKKWADEALGIRPRRRAR